MAALSRAAGPFPPDGPPRTAEDLLAVVRVHLDRVHDAVRRLGCAPPTAVEVVETSAVELVEAVADAPRTVGDPVGWWFARARELAVRAAARPDAPLGGGPLSVDEHQQRLSRALDQLPERERLALLLRDAYDLPAASVGAGLRSDPDAAMELVARARLALLPLTDEEPAPAVPSHADRLGVLGRLAEGGPVAARDATVRRHSLSCAACRSVTDAQQRAHLLLAGITVAALPEPARERVLARAEQAARRRLPAAVVAPADDVLLASEALTEPPRAFSPLLVALSVVLAALAGLGLGLVLSDRPAPEPLAGADGQVPAGVMLVSPAPSPPPAVSSAPTVAQVRPRTTVFVVPPPPPPPPPPSPTPSPSPSPVTATVALAPDRGPNGTQVTVTGTGFAPDTAVQVDYLDAEQEPTEASVEVTTDQAGAFTTELAARDPSDEPGPHEVVATDGTTTARAVFTAEP